MKKGYKQTEIGVIREDWEIARLGSIRSVKRRGTMLIAKVIMCGVGGCC